MKTYLVDVSVCEVFSALVLTHFSLLNYYFTLNEFIIPYDYKIYECESFNMNEDVITTTISFITIINKLIIKTFTYFPLLISFITYLPDP